MDPLIERTLREAYGRLVAILAARSRDIMAAEDALQDALMAALEQWPREGTPRDPEAWLMTVAKRRLLDGHRRNALTQEIVANWPMASAAQDHAVTTPLSDDRLELMLLCSHPAIDRAMHAPLMLQTVLGLNAERIAAAFLVSPSTMSQRLVRAKQKVRDAGIRFELPDPSVLEERISSLLDAIYAAYGTAWEDLAAAGPGRYLHQEATLLCKAVLQRLPTHAEALGLLALMRYTEARDHARRDADGAYVPLSEQDVQRWDRDILMEAEATLRKAAAQGQLGRYQLEAAIQSAHVTARLTGRKDPEAILQLYEALVQFAPSIGALVAHAAAYAEVYGAEAGLQLLDQLEPERVRTYQAFHALRAELFLRLQRFTEARIAYSKAIGSSMDPAVRQFLQRRLGTVP